MALHVYLIHHDQHGLGAVERAAAAIVGVERRLMGSPVIDGVIVVSTCNRVEVYVDAPFNFESRAVDDAILSAVGVDLGWTVKHHTEVLWHLFSVTCGLDSMVIGEREIAGQIRAALRTAVAARTVTFALTEGFERALRTSRRVASLTALSATGRSLVSVALELLGAPVAGTSVLLVGTGSYAGATVAALRAQGCSDISVFSVSGRGADFASSHGLSVADTLVPALSRVDLVVACRGRGTPVITTCQAAQALVARDGRELPIIDMSLVSDLEDGVPALPGVRVIDLTTVQANAPAADTEQLQRARDLVADGVAELKVVLDGRRMDPAVVALREAVAQMVNDEISRLPDSGPVSAADAAHALRRLAARLVHVPSVRAKQAATEGRSGRYLWALAEVYGIDAGLAQHAVDAAETPEAALADGRCPKDGRGCDVVAARSCPVTGWSIEKLQRVVHDDSVPEKAM